MSAWLRDGSRPAYLDADFAYTYTTAWDPVTWSASCGEGTDDDIGRMVDQRLQYLAAREEKNKGKHTRNSKPPAAEPERATPGAGGGGKGKRKQPGMDAGGKGKPGKGSGTAASGEGKGPGTPRRAAAGKPEARSKGKGKRKQPGMDSDSVAGTPGTGCIASDGECGRQCSSRCDSSRRPRCLRLIIMMHAPLRGRVAVVASVCTVLTVL